MPSNNRAKLNLRLPPEYAAKLEELAEKWNISKNAALLECIKAGAKNWEPYKPFTDYRKAAKPLDDEETKAAAIGARPERKRQRQEPPNSEFWGTYEEGRAEAREAFPQAKAHGRTFEELKANNAAYFDERGEEWRRGFADQFRELAEAETKESQTPKAKKGPAQGTIYRTRKEAAEIREAKEKAATAEAAKYLNGEITKAEYKKRLAEINKAATEPTKAGEKPSIEEIKKRLDRLLRKPKNQQKADKAEHWENKQNEEINGQLEALRADYQAGRISAAEYDRKAEALEDERPF